MDYFVTFFGGGARLLLCFALAGGLVRTPSTAAAKPPNIILIMVDDLGYEGVSAYGSPTYKTPHLDKLAAGGMLFNHCYSTPICTPSRVQLMTGKYNFRNYRRFGFLDPSQVTFANVLRNAGYQTTIAGKWQLGGDGAHGQEVWFRFLLPLAPEWPRVSLLGTSHRKEWGIAGQRFRSIWPGRNVRFCGGYD